MKIIRTTKDLRGLSDEYRKNGKSIGFVPTMGYLHEGHLSLVRGAKSECDVTIVSIFVNPIQFCPGEDLDRYPRDEKKDMELLEKEFVDIVFMPDVDELYPEKCCTFINVPGPLTENLCGRSRPGHFKGVATVVAKFLNIVRPHIMYLGEKDAQQAQVIKKMVADLNFPVKIHIMPVVREKDGLAMSSRNVYLSPSEREQGLSINKALNDAEKMVLKGERESSVLKKKITEILNGNRDLKIDYVEVVDLETMESVSTITNSVLIAIAVIVGRTRLIDNVIVSL